MTESTHLNHAMRLIYGVKNVRIAGVVFVGDSVFLQREGYVVDVGHIKNDLHPTNNEIVQHTMMHLNIAQIS